MRKDNQQMIPCTKMTQILKLSDNTLKQLLYKCSNKQLGMLLRQTKKPESLSKEMEGIKNKMEILELKNNRNFKISEMKKLNRMEMPEKRISEIEDRQTEIIQHEQ